MNLEKKENIPNIEHKPQEGIDKQNLKKIEYISIQNHKLINDIKKSTLKEILAPALQQWEEEGVKNGKDFITYLPDDFGKKYKINKVEKTQKQEVKQDQAKANITENTKKTEIYQEKITEQKNIISGVFRNGMLNFPFGVSRKTIDLRQMPIGGVQTSEILQEFGNITIAVGTNAFFIKDGKIYDSKKSISFLTSQIKNTFSQSEQSKIYKSMLKGNNEALNFENYTINIEILSSLTALGKFKQSKNIEERAKLLEISSQKFDKICDILNNTKTISIDKIKTKDKSDNEIYNELYKAIFNLFEQGVFTKS